MRRSIDRSHAAFADALVHAVFVREHLAEQFVAGLFQHRTVSRTQSSGVPKLPATSRTSLHRALVASFSSFSGNCVEPITQFPLRATRLERQCGRQNAERGIEESFSSFRILHAAS